MTVDPTTDHDPAVVERRVRDLLDANRLCSMATVDRTTDPPTPHVCTLFYAVDDADGLGLYVLTPPDTAHARHLAATPSTAVAVYDGGQAWTDEKRGLQAFGSAERVRDEDEDEDEDGDGGVAHAFATYAERFPALTDLADGPGELESLDSAFYRVTVRRLKLFDEPAFGTETWVEARVADGS